MVSTLQRRKRVLDKLPEAFKACEGWNIVQNDYSCGFKLFSEEEFDNQHRSVSLEQSFCQIQHSVSKRLSDDAIEDNEVNVFHILLDEFAVNKIVRFTSHQLLAKNLKKTTSSEYLRFLAHKDLVSRFNLSPDKVWTVILPMIAKEEHFTLMSPQRFTELLQNTRGYDIRDFGVSDDETWLEQRNLLRKLNALEKEIFAPSVKLFLNKKMVYWWLMMS